MTDLDLFALNQEGFIPGPGEEEALFLARVAETKRKFNEGAWIPESHWNWTREYLSQLFDVKPLYICAFYSNRKLAPWQGGASWIEGRALHSVQLRKSSWLARLSREEILAHEAVHAVRCGFQEDGYEEFFAYMTSEKQWKRVLGPILQRPWEAWPFLLLIAGGIVWPVCYLGAAIWSGIGFCRLIRRHNRLRKAAAWILKKIKDPRLARAVLLRLSDEEIEAFSRSKDVEAYAKRQTCLRWKIIQNYLKGDYGKENRC